MWRLRRAEVQGVRRAVDVTFDVEAPVVVLQGPTGSGKSSALLGVGWGLAGEVRTPELGRLSKDELNNPLMNTAVDLELVDEDGVVLEVLRTLTMAGTHDLMVGGSKFRNLGAAKDHLEGTLGCSLDQLGYLTSAHRLVGMDGLEQAQLLLGLMGPQITSEWLSERLGDLPNVVPSGGETGYAVLQSALAKAETDRTEQGREKKRLEAEAEKAQAVVMQHCREAKVPGPGNIEAAVEQAEKAQRRAQQRLQDLKEQAEQAEKHTEQVRRAEEALTVAEEHVADLKEQRAEADEVREEREAERAELKETLEAKQAKMDEIEEKGRAAREKRLEATAALQAWPDPAELTDCEECPTCRQSLPPEVLEEVEVEYHERKSAVDAAAEVEEGLIAKLNAVEAEIAHLPEPLPPIPPADELERKFDEAKTEADEAFTRLEALREQDVPDKPSQQAIDAAQKTAQELSAKLEALTHAQGAQEDYEAAEAEAEEAADLYDRYNKLVDKLRDIIREVAEEAIEPVLERSNEMLDGRLTLDYSPDDGIEAVYGEDERRPVKELSTGERLMVGVTLQASIARALGVGLCLVDDASVWDPDTQRQMLVRMHDIGRKHGIVWLVASAQPVEYDPFADNVQIIDIEGGYST